MRRPQGTSRGKAAQCECGLAQRARLQRFLRLHVFRRAVTVQSWRRGSGACDTCGFPLLVDALTSRRRHWDRQCAGTAVRQLGAPAMHLYKCTHRALANSQGLNQFQMSDHQQPHARTHARKHARKHAQSARAPARAPQTCPQTTYGRLRRRSVRIPVRITRQRHCMARRFDMPRVYSSLAAHGGTMRAGRLR